MRMRMNVTYENRPDEPVEVMAWQADFIGLERKYPEVEFMEGKIDKLEHIAYLGWSTLHRAGRTDKDFEEWWPIAEVDVIDDDEIATVKCPECGHEFDFNIDEHNRAKAKAAAAAAREAGGEGEAPAG